MKHILRKHGNIIMAVLGIFLMIAFSLPTYFSSSNEDTSTPVGTLEGKKVTTNQLPPYSAELKILAQFPMQISNRLLQYIIPEQDEQEQNIHWFLLLREAQALGIAPTEGEITQQVASLQLTDVQLSEQLEMRGISQPMLRQSIQHALMVMRVLDITMGGDPMSVPEMESLADRGYSTAQVNYLTLDASGVALTAVVPSADAINKQFALYKSVVPMSVTGQQPAEINGHHYPFGYKYADRVTVEYLKFERGWLEGHFKPTNDDYEDAYRYYTDHPSDKRFQPQAAPANTTQPALVPFDSVRDALVQDQVDARINAFLKRVTDSARDQAAAPWKDNDTDKGFRKDVMNKGTAGLVSYDDIVKAIKTNPDFEGYPVVHGTTTGLLDKMGLEHLQGIGAASFQMQKASFTFPELALHVKELDPPADAPTARLFLQEGVDGPLLTEKVGDKDGDVYLYRVIAADKTHEPASVDEVRGQVVEDLGKIAAYEAKQAQAKEMAKALGKDTFDQVGAKAGLALEKSGPLIRANKGKPGAEPGPGFIDAAFSVIGNATETQPSALATTLDDDAALKVFVIGGARYAPMTGEHYWALKEQLLGASQMKAIEFAFQWLSLDELAKRLKFVPMEPFKEKGGA